VQHHRSYRTYEEWKLIITTTDQTISVSSYRTYEEWKPMNKNRRAVCWRVLTVPMRNGNNDKCENEKMKRKSSYRTYEEWKLVTISVALNTGKSSYRTYEEWKPSRPIALIKSSAKFLPYL